MLSPSDTAIVFILALLLFGPDQLPKLARQLGEAMRHVQNTTHTFMQEMERAAEPPDMLEPGVPAAIENGVPAAPENGSEPSNSVEEQTPGLEPKN